MFRSVLILAICIALAGMNVTGSHLHFFEDSDAEHAHGMAQAEHGSHVVSELDHHHASEHDGAKVVDLDLGPKLFGKLSLSPVLAAAVSLYLLVAVSAPGFSTWLRHVKLLRPPRRRSAFYLLPPSNAPPATAFSR